MDSQSYVGFIFWLGTGLCGLCVMFTTLFDTILADWDLGGSLRDWYVHSRLRHPYVTTWRWQETSSPPEENQSALLPLRSR